MVQQAVQRARQWPLRLWMIVALSVVALAAVMVPASAADVTISGQVFDADGEEPLADTPLLVFYEFVSPDSSDRFREDLRTGPDGRFDLVIPTSDDPYIQSLLDQDDMTLRVSVTALEPSRVLATEPTLDLDIADGQLVDAPEIADFVAREANLSVTVGNPDLASADTEHLLTVDQLWTGDDTGADLRVGLHEVDLAEPIDLGLPPGSWLVHVDERNYDTATDSWVVERTTVRSMVEVDVDLAAVPAELVPDLEQPLVSGVVRDADGEPAVDAALVARVRPEGFARSSLLTLPPRDAAGRFALSPPDGQLTLTAFPSFVDDDELLPADLEIAITGGTADPAAPHDLVLRSINVRGSVLDPDGAAAGDQGVDVERLVDGSYELVESVQTRFDGGLRLALDDGDWRLTARAWGEEVGVIDAVPVQVEVSGGTAVPNEPLLQLRSPNLTGTLTDPEGTPLPDGGQVRIDRKQADGSFDFHQNMRPNTGGEAPGHVQALLEPGTYRLTPIAGFGSDFFDGNPTEIEVGDDDVFLDLTFSLRATAIEGTVVDSQGMAVSGAEVWAQPVGVDDNRWPAVLTTDENGRFEVALPDGQTELTVELIEFSDHVAPDPIVITVNDGVLVEPSPPLQIVLDRASVHGQLVPASGVDPGAVAGASIQIHDGSGSLVAWLSADQTGRFAARLDPGDYTLEVWPRVGAPAAPAGPFAFQIDDQGVARVGENELALPWEILVEAPTLTGVVTTDVDDPGPDGFSLQVQAFDFSTGDLADVNLRAPVASVQSDGDGAYALTVAPGEYLVRAQRSQGPEFGRSALYEVTVGTDGTATIDPDGAASVPPLDLPLLPPTVAGLVVDGASDDGAPTAAEVTVRDADGDLVIVPFTTASDGVFWLWLEPATYTLRADGGDPATITITGDATTEVVLSAGDAPDDPDPDPDTDPTTTSLAVDPDTGTVTGQPLEMIATVQVDGAGDPTTGTVTFTAGDDILGTAACTVTSLGEAEDPVSCEAFLSVDDLPVGTTTLTASFSGTDTTEPSDASSAVTVSSAATTLAATTVPDPAGSDDTVQANVTVGVTEPGAGTPTGTVTVDLVGGADDDPAITTLDLQDAAATGPLTLPPGEHELRFTYPGDDRFEGAQTTVTQTVLAATTSTVTLDPDGPVVGQEVELVVDITAPAAASLGAPDGDLDIVVSMDDGATVVEQTVQLVDGTAAVDLTFPQAGDATITATYTGAGLFEPSSVTQPVAIAAAATTTDLDGPATVDVGEQATFVATVAPTALGGGSPTGTVELRDGDTDGLVATATVAPTGDATFDVDDLAPGTYDLWADYLGTADHLASTSDLLLVVVRAQPTITTTVTPPEPVYGQDVAIDVTVATDAAIDHVPTGTITIDVEGSIRTLDLQEGAATFELVGLDDLDVGTNTIATTYVGDERTSPGEDTTDLLVAPAPTGLEVGAVRTPTTDGRDAAFDVTVTAVEPGAGTPEGEVVVDVLDGSGISATSTPVTLTNGAATAAFQLDEGTYDLQARYLGSDRHQDRTSAAFLHEVAAATTTTTIVLDPDAPVVTGQPVTASVTVAADADGLDAPTGEVDLQLQVDGATEPVDLGTHLVDGNDIEVALPVEQLSVGTHQLVATYDGDERLDPSSATSAIEVAPAEVAVDVSTDTGLTVDDPIDLTIDIAPVAPGAGTPTGTVTVSLAGAPDAEQTVVLDEGQATAVFDPQPAGEVVFTVDYDSDDGAYLDVVGESATVTILEVPPLTVVLDADPLGGVAPLDVTFTIAAAGGDGSVDWEFDPGDGSDPQQGTGRSVTITHLYEDPGSHRARIVVEDGVRRDVATVTVEVAEPQIEPVARAGDDRIVTTGEPVRLDASASEPSATVAAYTWDIGDGATADGAAPQVSWDTAGVYTVTVQVEVDGRTATDTLTVTVEDPLPDALEVTLQTEQGQPIAAGDVVVVEPDGALRDAATDADGLVRLSGLPDGEIRVAGYAPGFLPAWSDAVVTDGQGEVTIALRSGQVADAELDATRLTDEEAAALGVDLTDEDNIAVWEVEVGLNIERGSLGGFIVIDEPMVLTRAGGWGWLNEPQGWACEGSSCTRQVGGSRVRMSAPGSGGGGWGGGTASPPTLTFLIIPVEGRFLKEFFDVHLEVANLAPDGFDLVDVTAELPLPEGLGLAAMVSGAQTATVDLGTIPGSSSRGHSWIVRGDDEGTYPLTATARGDLEPFAAPVEIEARTAEPIRIWGASALRFLVEADEHVSTRAPYQVRIGLQNVADIDVYGTQLTYLEGTENAIYQPRQQRTFRIGTLPAGETVWTEDATLVPAVWGWVNLDRSYVAEVAGTAPDAEITTRPVTQPVASLRDLRVSARSDSYVVSYEDEPDATDLQWFVTPDLDTQFPSTPAVVEAVRDGIVALPRDTGPGELALSSTIDEQPTLQHPVVQLSAATSGQPRSALRFTHGAASMCGEPATLRATLLDDLLELSGYEVQVGDGQPQPFSLAGGSVADVPVRDVDPEEVPEDGLTIRVRAIDELGNTGRWATTTLLDDCPGRPVVVLAAGLMSSLSDGDDYLADLYGRPTDGPDQSVVGMLTDLGFDLGHDGTGPRNAANRTIIEYSYRGASVRSTSDGPVFQPADYRRRDTLHRVDQLAGGAISDSFASANPFAPVEDSRAAYRRQARDFVADLARYDQLWQRAHAEWLSFHLVGHSLGARQALEIALEAQLQAETCRDEGGPAGYPCERYDQMIAAVVSVSGAVYPSAIVRDIGLASCGRSADDWGLDRTLDIVFWPGTALFRGSAALTGIAQRSVINDEMITASQQGARLDTMGTGQDQCLSLNATIADATTGVGQHRHWVDANGKEAHSALIDGGGPDAPGDFLPLRDLLGQRIPDAGDQVLLETAGEMPSGDDETTVMATDPDRHEVRLTVLGPDEQPALRSAAMLLAGDDPIGSAGADADGRITLSDVPAGSYDLQVGGPGWSTDLQPVTVDGAIDLEVTLRVAPYVFLELRGEDDDRPLAGITVEVVDAGGAVVGTGMTDLTGGVFVTDLPDGDLTVSFDDPLDLHGAAAFSTVVTSTTEPPFEARQTERVPVDPLPDDGQGDAGDDDSPGGGAPGGGAGDDAPPEGGDLEEDGEPTGDDLRAVLDDVIDVGSASAHADGIAWLLATEIAQGFDDGTFRPLDDVTRGQLATLLVGALELAPAEPAFSDVRADATHAAAIGAAAAAGIVEGFDDGTFRPGESVTRAQFSSMLARALALDPLPPGFPDVPADATHAGAIGAAADAGIVTGYDDGTFRPGLAISREQVASMLYRALADA